VCVISGVSQGISIVIELVTEKSSCGVAPENKRKLLQQRRKRLILDLDFCSDRLQHHGASMSRSAKLEILQHVLDAFNDHDLDRIMSFFHEDCVLEMPKGPEPYGSRCTGHDAVRAALATRFEGIPDVHYGDATHIVDGDTGSSRWILTGTGTDGRKICVRGCDFFTFRGDRIVKKDSYWKIRD
jgi:ketosteroid isomerase-like protein